MTPARIKRYLPWLAVLGVAAVIRIRIIGQLGTLWFDEAFSRHFAKLPFGQMIEGLRPDVHPPLHAIALHYWMRIFGDGVTAMRSMSLVASLAGLVVLALLARALFDKRTAFLAMTIAALSPLMAYYGADARMYAALFLLSTLSSLALWRWLKGSEGDRRIWFWASFALVLTHVTGAAVVAAQAFFLLRSPERHGRLRALLSQFLLIGSVFAFWLAPIAAARFGAVGSEWQFRAMESGVGAVTALSYWVWLAAKDAETAVVSVLLGLLVLAGLLRHSERKPHFRIGEEGEYLLTWFAFAFIPFLPVAAVAPRYLTVAVPPFFLLLAHGFLNAAKGRPYALPLGVAAAVFASSLGLMVQLTSRPYNWDKAVDWISERYRTGDRVVFGWFADELGLEATQAPPFSRDLSRFDMVGLYPFDDGLDEHSRLAAHAGQLAIERADLERLRPLFDGATRVFFIPNGDWALKDGGSASEALNDWLRTNGWFLGEHFEPGGRTGGVWLMVRKQ
jgi:hypothetical protein